MPAYPDPFGRMDPLRIPLSNQCLTFISHALRGVEELHPWVSGKIPARIVVFESRIAMARFTGKIFI
jgi:hypothetical protein